MPIDHVICPPLDDGDVSSAPISSRKSHYPSHGYTASDASLASVAAANNGPLPGTKAYYDTVAARSARLTNMPSSASFNSADSGPPGQTHTHEQQHPHSPTPQLPHAPSPSRHRPSSPHDSSASASPTKTTALEPKTFHGNATGLVPPPAEAVHHPAPHGFLAKMSAEDLQESVRQAIAGAGADGIQRNYKINAPPTDRPVRIYADGVYDLVGAAVSSSLQLAKQDPLASFTMVTLWLFGKPSLRFRTYTFLLVSAPMSWSRCIRRIRSCGPRSGTSLFAGVDGWMKCVIYSIPDNALTIV